MTQVAAIDDDVIFVESLSRTLNEEVRSFAEVEDFVDEGFDVVFTDLRLVNTYGKETVSALRKKTAAPIIIMSGLGVPFLSASDLASFIEAGADEFYPKDVISDPSFKYMVETIIQKGRGA